ncbi:MAG TPA: YjbQ family protein [Proteobacteria bacterium]|nr:YjbQ family protein [Pseudomonadota bacterium]
MLFTHQLRSRHRRQMIDITAKLQADLDAVACRNGICMVFVQHTTAAVTVNENADADVPLDLFTRLAQLVPERDAYRHLEGNSDAHILSVLIGTSLVLPVDQGKLVLGGWQGIFFVELDGPRQRSYVVKLLAG